MNDKQKIEKLIELLDLALEALEEHDDEGTLSYIVEELEKHHLNNHP